MSVVWFTASFNYFVLSFLVSTFCKPFVAGISLGVADMIAFGVAGIVYEKVGTKVSLGTGFAIATMAGVLIILFGLQRDDSAFFIFLVFSARLGISFAFCIVFVAHSSLFPVLFSATAFGFLNFWARLFSGFSMELTMVEEPYPMLVFTGSSILALMLSCGLQKNP